MSNIQININSGETKTITFATKGKFNNEDITFTISSDATLPTATSTEITNPTSWFDPNIKEYSIAPDGMLAYLNDNMDITDLLSNSNNGNFTISSYEVNLSRAKNGINVIVSYLSKSNYKIYVENDIDEFFNNGDTVALILKFDGMNVIIECYRLIN